MRCLTLADSLRERGGEVAFICREHAGNLCDHIVKSGFAVYRLPVLPPQEKDAEQNAPLAHAAWLGGDQASDMQAVRRVFAETGPADWLIVDHYALDFRWESALRAYAGKIMAIDDLADRVHDCDILLDQNLYADLEKRYQQLLPANCEPLLGPKYALLRREFAAARQRLPIRDGSIKTVIVFMGGADADNATAMVLDALQLLNRSDISVEVVLGASNPHVAAIRQRCDGLPHTRCHVQVANLAEFMLAADFAVGAGGVSTWERCALGLPAMIIPVAVNQVAIAREAANCGAAFFAGELTGLNKYRLAELLCDALANAAALQAMAQKASRLVDAYGAGRVAQRIFDS